MESLSIWLWMVLFIFVFIWMVLWIILPFVVFGIKNRMDKLIQIAREIEINGVK